MPLQASSGFRTNSIFWLRSLLPPEQGPTRRVLEDLEPFFNKLEIPFQMRDVKTAPQLYSALKSLANPNVKPILQLDMHGSKKGLLLAGSGDLAPWHEVVPRLRAINVASGGNLCVVAGVCFAFFAIMQVSITQPSPVNILIAPDREVAVGKLEDGLAEFYKAPFSGSDISDAHSDFLGEPFKVFHAERFLVIALCKYIRNACKGKGGSVRRERLLTEVLLAGRPRTRDNLGRIRKQIKDGTRPDQKMVNRYAERFLLGKPCPFTIDELLKEVEESARNIPTLERARARGPSSK